MPVVIPESVREQAIALRVRHRLGLDAIQRRLGVQAPSRGTLSTWLRDYPLTAEERRARAVRGALTVNATRPVYTPAPARIPNAVLRIARTRGGRRTVSVAAVERQLRRAGADVEDDPTRSPSALVVHGPAGRTWRLRVRSAHRRPGDGWPVIKTSTERGVSYTRHDCDGVVGYDLESDRTFFFPIRQLGGRQVSASEASAAAWRDFLAALAPRRRAR